ncbi:hypothetical protein DSO57_1005757 [Entomophthora muscae]|uniref:Uncharacterized protein n=1 Tax=Entomophthora muscae TaxID=34485 RepID=A0ACC2U7A9_9FUNG|nr:hypothetical protein DSO57_1005757 [Entomophthora muscae]
MTLPLTLWPDRLQKSDAINESTSTQIFGVVYITVTAFIDSMVPAGGPWALLGKFTNLVVGPSCWACLPESSQEPPPTGWIPDIYSQIGCGRSTSWTMDERPDMWLGSGMSG